MRWDKRTGVPAPMNPHPHRQRCGIVSSSRNEDIQVPSYAVNKMIRGGQLGELTSNPRSLREQVQEGQSVVAYTQGHKNKPRAHHSTGFSKLVPFYDQDSLSNCFDITFHRRDPTGGTAQGIPKYCLTPQVDTIPCIAPAGVSITLDFAVYTENDKKHLTSCWSPIPGQQKGNKLALATPVLPSCKFQSI